MVDGAIHLFLFRFLVSPVERIFRTGLVGYGVISSHSATDSLNLKSGAKKICFLPACVLHNGPRWRQNETTTLFSDFFRT